MKYAPCPRCGKPLPMVAAPTFVVCITDRGGRGCGVEWSAPTHEALLRKIRHEPRAGDFVAAVRKLY